MIACSFSSSSRNFSNAYSSSAFNRPTRSSTVVLLESCAFTSASCALATSSSFVQLARAAASSAALAAASASCIHTEAPPSDCNLALAAAAAASPSFTTLATAAFTAHATAAACSDATDAARVHRSCCCPRGESLSARDASQTLPAVSPVASLLPATISTAAVSAPD